MRGIASVAPIANKELMLRKLSVVRDIRAFLIGIVQDCCLRILDDTAVPEHENAVGDMVKVLRDIGRKHDGDLLLSRKPA